LYNFFAGFLEKEILYDPMLVELYCVELADHIFKENEGYLSSAETNEKLTLLDVRKRISACTGLHIVFNAFCDVFLDIHRGIDKDQIHSSMRLVRQCIRIIHEQYGKDISLPDAAKQLYISSNYLSKIFSAEMGKSFSRYLLEYRINMAKKLLRESNDKVYEIAERVGYADVVHFSKIFKQATGHSPNRYRNQR
jgi:two-component system response regulator YesN